MCQWPYAQCFLGETYRVKKVRYRHSQNQSHQLHIVGSHDLMLKNVEGPKHEPKWPNANSTSDKSYCPQYGKFPLICAEKRLDE
jgi:hypothetical protein